MFLEIRILSSIEKLRDSLKDIQSFEDPVKKSTKAGRRCSRTLRDVERDLKALRKEILEIRKHRVVTGEKKAI